MDEVFCVVNKDDFPMFTIRNKDELHKHNYLHRGVHVFIETFGGYFILQKKALHTENGGLLSSAVSGHVRHCETYKEAAIRETKEELGLDVDPLELEEITYIKPCSATGNEFVTLYSYLLDPKKELIKINESELDEVIIMPLQDVIKDVVELPERYSPAFKFLFDIFITQNIGGVACR